MTARSDGVRAGEVLDALVAEALGECAHRDMAGWSREGPDGDRTLNCGACHRAPHVPRYSTEIAAAWTIPPRIASCYPEFIAALNDWLRTDKPFALPIAGLLLLTEQEAATAICRATLAAFTSEPADLARLRRAMDMRERLNPPPAAPHREPDR